MQESHVVVTGAGQRTMAVFMRFKVLSEITGIEVIAKGVGIRDRFRLRRSFGPGRWRKLKGIATIEYTDGRICIAELHWYEAHGIGRKNLKVKRVLRQL